MSNESTEKKSKKSFDFAHTSVFVADPLELRIVGGAKLLEGTERGPLDTEDDESHPLWDGIRLATPITEDEVLNVLAYGINVPVLIAKVDGIPTVVDGRTRVRWARVANARRAARGEKPLRVKCDVVRTDEQGLLARMAMLNDVGHEVTALDRVNKIHRLMETGMTEPDIAITFGISVGQVKALLSFEDNASAKVKKAVESGKLSLTAGIELVKAGDAETQDKALSAVAEALPAGARPVSVRQAREAANNAKGKKKPSKVGVNEMRQLLEYVMHRSGKLPSTTSPNTLGWYAGVEDALSILLGDECSDKMREMLKSALAWDGNPTSEEK